MKPRLLLLFLIPFWLLSPGHSQPIVEPVGLSSFTESKVFKATTRKNEYLADFVKGESEVLKYFQTHLHKGLPSRNKTSRQVDSQVRTRFSEFLKYKEPFMDRAAEAFGVPFALTSCMMFRESWFNEKAMAPETKAYLEAKEKRIQAEKLNLANESNDDRKKRIQRAKDLEVREAPAEGIAQFVPQTYKGLKADLNFVNRNMPNFLKYQDMVKNMDEDTFFNIRSDENDNPFVIWRQFIEQRGPYYRVAQRSGDTRSITSSRSNMNRFLTHKALINDMRIYLSNVIRDLSSAQKKKLFPNTQEKKYPKGDDILPPSSFDRFKTSKLWVSGYIHYFVKQMLMEADILFNPTAVEANADPLLPLLVVAGSYNLGPAKYKLWAKVTKKNRGKPRALTNLCRELSKIKETRGYMLSVRRCLSKGSDAPPTTGTTDYSAPGNDPCRPVHQIQRTSTTPSAGTPAVE